MPSVFAPNDESPGGVTKSQAAVPYDHSCWAQAGEAIGVSILDAYGHNCYSRLPASRYGSLARLLSLSPSYNSHRGQYGPPDNMTEILGATYTSVFDQQVPCRRSSCCWHQHIRLGTGSPGAICLPAGCIASSTGALGVGRPHGHFPAHHANASLGFSLPLSSWPSSASTSPAAVLPHCAVPYPDLAANSDAGCHRAVPKGSSSKSPTRISYKCTVTGSRRHHRSSPPHPTKGQVQLCGGAAKGSGWTRGSIVSSKRPAEKPSRHQRVTRTASTGALIVAGGTAMRSPAVATAPWTSHQ